MSDQAWTVLNIKCGMLKLHDMRGTDGSKCQKIICFTLRSSAILKIQNDEKYCFI